MPDDRSEHYSTSRPTSLSQPAIYDDTLRGVPLKLWTDRGVFSRGHTDPGSAELITAMDLTGARRILDLGCGYGVIGIAA
ncbi:MAG TPA: methyltransferase, partial [Armatimonadota bacterium]|nr:methyltransferase [Armatimonadota bacterium]